MERKENEMEIKANRMDRGFELFQEEFEDKAIEVLRSGWYILGKEVSDFEDEFAAYTQSKYCVGLASGLDALWIALKNMEIGPGDEVIVQANTYIASVMAITINGATPVFVEPDEYYNIDVTKIEEKITEKTKAVMVVHLYGQASNMAPVLEICKRHHLKLVEDCAQSHGACFEGKMTGTFGDAGCFSFYPTKNMGAFGDAGCMITDRKELAKNVRIFRNYGSEKRYYNKVIGANSRLDEIQAGFLRIRLKYLQQLNQERECICQKYLREIHNEQIALPKIRKGATTVWHQFVIRCKSRKELIFYLADKGIGTIIHYPIPPHLAEAYQYLGHKKGDFPITERYADEILSIPLYNGMKEDEQEYVIRVLNEFR